MISGDSCIVDAYVRQNGDSNPRLGFSSSFSSWEESASGPSSAPTVRANPSPMHARRGFGCAVSGYTQTTAAALCAPTDVSHTPDSYAADEAHEDDSDDNDDDGFDDEEEKGEEDAMDGVESSQ